MTALTQRWSSDEPLDLRGRDLEGALVRRERTRLRCDGVAFDFRVAADELTDTGLVRQFRLSVCEASGAATAQPIAAELVVRPVIPAVSVEKLGPWERTALRQAARKLLLRVADEVSARG